MDYRGYLHSYYQPYVLPVYPRPGQYNTMNMPLYYYPVMGSYYVPLQRVMMPLINVGYALPGEYAARAVPEHIPAMNGIPGIRERLRGAGQAAPLLHCPCLSQRPSRVAAPFNTARVSRAASRPVEHSPPQRAQAPDSARGRRSPALPLTRHNVKQWEGANPAPANPSGAWLVKK